MLRIMARVWIVLAGLVLVVGAVHTAYVYGLMIGTEEYNSAPSSVAFVYLIPYLLVGVILLVVALLAARRSRGVTERGNQPPS